MNTPTFPFSAVAGQAHFKLALILAAIYPAIGGVLVSGPRGSAKSTLARGLADLLMSDKGNRSPFITLPLGASEEMVTGTLNLQQVLNQQTVEFQEGLLAKANGGVLYVDEVNLLADNLVDLLLDVATSGTNIIERDGISHSHRTQFLLMGTMNPDEGELRPQLHDRFGFSVNLDNQYSIAERVDIVQRREAFDTQPQVFIEQYESQQQMLRDGISTARSIIDRIRCKDELRVLIAERCHQANVDGLRADIVWYRAALAHAAWRAVLAQDTQRDLWVSESDISAVEELVLAHRRHESSSTPPPSSQPPSSDAGDHSPKQHFTRPQARETEQQSNGARSNSAGDWGSMPPQQQLSTVLKRGITLPSFTRAFLEGAQKMSHQRVKHSANTAAQAFSDKGKKGALHTRSIDWFASLVANVGQWPLTQLRFRKASMSQPVLHLILLDTSASTLQQGLLANAKAAVNSIAQQAYVRREQLSIIGFGNQQVDILLGQQKAPKAVKAYLDSINGAGGTPLREVLIQARQQQQQLLRSQPNTAVRTYLITDGRTTQAFEDLNLLGDVMVIDTEQGDVKRGKAPQIAKALGAHYFPLAYSF